MILCIRNSDHVGIHCDTTPHPDLLPLGTVVTLNGDYGIIIAYNGNHPDALHPAGLYPYIVLWPDGYFDAYVV